MTTSPHPAHKSTTGDPPPHDVPASERFSRMRIALLTRRFNPSGGGTERDLSITARCLRAAGHEVSIYAEEVRAPSVDFAVERVSGLRLPRTLAVLRFGLLAASRARRDGADLVVSFARVVGADVLRSGGGSHASYVRAARRWQSGAAALAMRVFPYHRAQIFIEKRGFKCKGLRKALAVSNFVADDLTRSFQLPADRVLTLYNGVDLERFSPHDEAARARARDRYRIPGDARVVVFVGNGFARKGLGFLIDALPA